tara:strand:- start:619 stop:786 length:168 start_codon:yes stop_codon:yes gene_type:complete
MENSNKREEEYIKSLNEIEKKGYEIAKSHLGSSFSLKKSIGYKQWKKENNKDNNN